MQNDPLAKYLVFAQVIGEEYLLQPQKALYTFTASKFCKCLSLDYDSLKCAVDAFLPILDQDRNLNESLDRKSTLGSMRTQDSAMNVPSKVCALNELAMTGYKGTICRADSRHIQPLQIRGARPLEAVMWKR